MAVQHQDDNKNQESSSSTTTNRNSKTSLQKGPSARIKSGKFFQTFAVLLILGGLVVVFNRALHLTTYVDYFEPSQVAKTASNNMSITAPTVTTTRKDPGIASASAAMTTATTAAESNTRTVVDIERNESNNDVTTTATKNNDTPPPRQQSQPVAIATTASTTMNANNDTTTSVVASPEELISSNVQRESQKPNTTLASIPTLPEPIPVVNRDLPQGNETERKESSTTDSNTTATINTTAEERSNFPELVVWNDDVYRGLQAQTLSFSPDQKFLVDKEIGYISNETGTTTEGKLIVNVNETYMFWHDGQTRLCELLKRITLASSIDGTQPVPSALLNITMDCVDHALHKQGFGQGNWITALYAARMATALAGVDFKFQCTDGQESKMELLLPWFDQYIEAPGSRISWPYGGDRPSEGAACTPRYSKLQIDRMASQIQSDIRRMAVTLLGTRDSIRQHPDVPQDATPLIPNIQLDDAAIHFRCGDVLGGAKRNDFGMIRFWAYKQRIPNTTESIGILTQPFEKGRNRGVDQKKSSNCRHVVNALVNYLREFAPRANISIHNGVNETFPLAYARLAMANYSITSLSSFGIFPILGTFGQGYYQRGNRGVNPFAKGDNIKLDNVHEMRGNVRGTWDMFGKSVENLIDWFTNDTAADF